MSSTKTIPFLGKSRTLSESKQNGLVQQKTNLFDKILSGRKSFSVNMEEIIDIEKDYDNFTQRDLKILKPRTLYNESSWKLKTSVFKKQREDHLKIGDNDCEEIEIISKQACQSLLKSGYKIAHIGMIVIGIKGLARAGLGTKTLVVISDKGISLDSQKQIIAVMEVDMNQNIGLFYCCPDSTYDLKTLTKYLKISLMTKGYEGIAPDHKNLAVTTVVIGKMSHNTNINYRVNIDSIVNAVASKGISMILPEPVDPKELAGKSWNLNRIFGPKEAQTLNPQGGKFFQENNGNISVRFTDYASSSKPTNWAEESSDDES